MPRLPEGTVHELAYLLLTDEEWQRFDQTVTEDGRNVVELQPDGRLVINDPQLAEIDKRIREGLGLSNV